MLRSSRSTTEDRHNRIMATIPPASPLSTSPNDCCSLKAPRGTAEATEVMSANTLQRFYPHHSLDTAVCVFVSLPGCPLCRTSMSTQVETSSPDSSSLATTYRKSSVNNEQTLTTVHVLWCMLQSLCPAVSFSIITIIIAWIYIAPFKRPKDDVRFMVDVKCFYVSWHGHLPGLLWLANGFCPL